MHNTFWHSEFPVGDPFGGVPYGEYNDPVTMGVVAGGSAAASIGGGLFGKSSAKKAAKIQSGAAQRAQDALGAATSEANSVLGDGYRQQANLLMPWLNAGGGALNQLQWGLGQDSQTFDPNAQLGPRKSADDYRTELADKFTTKAPRNKYGDIKFGQSDKIDEAGLTAAINAKIAEDDARYAAAANGPQFQGQGEKGGLLRNFAMSDFQEDPGYQFALEQGQRGIQGSAAAGGSLLSGATLKALTRFNQDTANNQFQNSYDRFNQNKIQNLNTLMNASGIGQQSAGAIGSYNMNANNSIANNLMGLGAAQAGLKTQAGNAQASGVIGGANALTQGIGGAINSLGSFNMMNTLKGMGSAGLGTGLGSMTRQSGYALPLNMNMG